MMDIAEAANAEGLMALSAKLNNRHGFTTGFENYCQSMFGDEGYRIAREHRHTVNMDLFKTDREAFFEWVHNLFPPI